MRLSSLFWEGEEIVLRPFEKRNITPSYINWLNDAEVVRYSNQRFHRHTYESCLHYFKTFSNSANKFLLIQDRNSGSALGTLTIYVSQNHRVADIGIMVGDKNYWGRGIGFDAFSTAVRVLADSGEFRKITAGTLAINKGMVQVMEKAGMTLEATRRDHELVDGVPTDIVFYAIFC